MPQTSESQRPSSSFPWWSLGLLLGILLVLLWKRMVDRQASASLVYEGPVQPKITLENVPAGEVAAPAGPIKEAPPPAAPKKQDDLKRLEGIGPKVQEKLNESGIYTFAQLARTSQKKLMAILDEAGYGYMNPESWPQQAKDARGG